MNRRDFILQSTALAVTGLTGCKTASEWAKKRILFGACRPRKDAALMKSIGYDFIEGTVADCFAPDKGVETWKRLKDEILSLPIPLRACNNFIPGTFQIVGPNAKTGPALDYAETALRRAEEVGVRYIVFGSNGARNAPGDPCDPKNRPLTEQAFEEYIEFCRQLCARVKDLKNVRILAEPLRPNGANYLNYVWQAVQVCEDVKSPRMGVIADIFHMTAGREAARSIVEADALLRHCHIADWKTRNYFGEVAANVPRFKSYFDALATIGYTGGVSVETGKNGWGAEADLEKNLRTSLAALRTLV